MTSKQPNRLRWTQARWVLPATLFAGALTLAAACDTTNAGGPAPNCDTDPSVTAGGGGNDSGATTGATTGSGAGEPTAETPTPQQVNARLHGCRKIRYESLGSLLADRGVNLTLFGGSQSTCQTVPGGCPAGEMCYCPSPPCIPVGNNNANPGVCVAAPGTPGFLYSTGEDAFSVPKDDSRRAEKDGHTTASAMRLFDIFIQAAPQIIANIGDPQMAPACAINGQGIDMFNPIDGSCNEEAVSCLIGTAATEDHILLCNLILDKANPNDTQDVVRKQHIAVATLMSAAHSCE